MEGADIQGPLWSLSLLGFAERCLFLCANDPKSLRFTVHPDVPVVRSPGSSLLQWCFSHVGLAAAHGCAAKSCSYPSSRAAGHAEQHAANGSVCLNSAGKCCWMVLDVKEGRERELTAAAITQNGRAKRE